MDPAARRTLEAVLGLLAGRRLAVLTGAGLSTDSGIPDYRSPHAVPRTPMTYQQFVGSVEMRRRYWARNHAGWQHMRSAVPNPGHRALAAMEARGLLSGLITQNVDRLHSRAGSSAVIDLHGRFDRVVCLGCHARFDRAEIGLLLERLNPERPLGVSDAGDVAPDADADTGDAGSFQLVACPVCDGVLKPDFVYFGENVPVYRVKLAYDIVDRADALLIAGSSLTVMSGLRFVRHAAGAGKPVVIVNRGRTRGDALASMTVDCGVSDALPWLADRLPAVREGGSAPDSRSAGMLR